MTINIRGHQDQPDGGCHLAPGLVSGFAGAIVPSLNCLKTGENRIVSPRSHRICQRSCAAASYPGG